MSFRRMLRTSKVWAQVFIAVIVFHLGTSMATADPVSDDYEHLIGHLVNDDVTSIDMIHIPYRMIFPDRIAPAKIRQWGNYNCHVDVSPEINKSLLTAVRDAHIIPIDGDWDLRWLLQINLKGNLPPVMIYLNGRTFVGAAQRGFLNDHPMALTRSLSRWLESIAGEYCSDLEI